MLRLRRNRSTVTGRGRVLRMLTGNKNVQRVALLIEVPGHAPYEVEIVVSVPPGRLIGTGDQVPVVVSKVDPSNVQVALDDLPRIP